MEFGANETINSIIYKKKNNNKTLIFQFMHVEVADFI